jgi:uroporphyrinogen-III synthase
MDSSLPLSGLSIVVTRPCEQAGQLSKLIEQSGGKAILFPLLEISPAADAQPLRALVARLHEFQLAIFISPNAVRYGMEALREGGFSVLPTSLKIATVGQGSARALRDWGVNDVIVPQHGYDSEALLAVPELQNVQGWHVVIFRGDGGRELLGDTLKARGATVEYAACYQRSKPQQAVGPLLAAHPDAISVTSSEAIANLWDMLDEAGRTQLARVPLFVPHARIAAAAHQLGWREVVITAGGNDGLLSGLVAWAQNRKST